MEKEEKRKGMIFDVAVETALAFAAFFIALELFNRIGALEKVMMDSAEYTKKSCYNFGLCAGLFVVVFMLIIAWCVQCIIDVSRLCQKKDPKFLKMSFYKPFSDIKKAIEKSKEKKNEKSAEKAKEPTTSETAETTEKES